MGCNQSTPLGDKIMAAAAHMPFPVASEEVSAAWLSVQLKTKVESFEINKIGMGFTADAWKVECTMADGAQKVVIMKLPHSLGIEKQKQHANDCKIEVMFYRDFQVLTQTSYVFISTNAPLAWKSR